MDCKAGYFVLIALCSSSWVASAAADDDAPLLLRLYANGGYTYSDFSTRTTFGGVDQVMTPASNGWGASAGLVFNLDFTPYADPYIEVVHLEQDDRQFELVGAGLRHNFRLDRDELIPFLAVGVGYLDLKWEQDPVPAPADAEESGRSLALTLQAGLEWQLLDNLALDARVRLDGYDVTTTIVQGSRVTQLEDRLSTSALIGLVYMFGQAAQQQAAPPSVVLPAPCPVVIPKVPLDSAGCPLPHFSFNLEYPFAEFSVQSLLDRPDFNVVQFLKTYPEYEASITGHTDDRGSAEFNQALSEKRAQAARHFLIENGIAPERVHADGKGESAPLVDNDSDAGRQANRRIEVMFERIATGQGD